MTHSKTCIALVALTLAAAGTAQAGDWTNSANYNGATSSQQNTPSNFSLRDPNGNLTLVDGQFTSANYSQQSGVQNATAGGVGTSGAGAAYGQASAIGNSLNVVTIGSNNTVVVNATQTNNGNQTATVALNGH